MLTLYILLSSLGATIKRTVSVIQCIKGSALNDIFMVCYANSFGKEAQEILKFKIKGLIKFYLKCTTYMEYVQVFIICLRNFSSIENHSPFKK